MRHALIVLVAVSCFAVASRSQTADELIAKNIQARGGMEKMKAIKTIRMTGRFEGGGGFTASVGQENQRPDLIRETFTWLGMTQVQAYDGATGWEIQPRKAARSNVWATTWWMATTRCGSKLR